MGLNGVCGAQCNVLQWGSMECYGAQYRAMGLNGVLWGSAQCYGAQCYGAQYSAMGLNGLLWDSMQSYGAPCSPMGSVLWGSVL